MSRIILASQSPRRQELIAHITPEFTVIVSDAEESLPEGLPPEDVPAYLAGIKAETVAADHPDDIVIGADTVVILDGCILGKPRDKDDAVRMLSALSGKAHTVVTGCAVYQGSRRITFSEQTRVEFYPLSDREILEYIATGEPFDKAGAYGIQGRGCVLVKRIEGDFFNVMGLPVARLKRELKRFGALSAE
ncbi:Maf family protein [Ruminococcus sp.]|uniref:Maf family protein n=1 Tax=Ruminococcus sp. TaxID=41978 RepID=UPI00386C92C2